MRAVPWRNIDEWHYVYERIFSLDGKQRKAAIDQIRVWRLKRLRAVPLSVECTANLTETLLALKSSSTLGCSIQDIQLSLITAIVRMVNGFLDAQQKGAYARSITKIAEEIGMPRVLVDIRHDGTHGEIPSLQSLILAAETALSWLKIIYWDRRALNSIQEEENEDNENLSNEIEAVVTAFKRANNNNSNNDDDDWKLNLIKIFQVYKSESLVKELLKPGRLFPKDKNRLSRLCIGNERESEGYFELWLPFLLVCIDSDLNFEYLVFKHIIEEVSSLTDDEITKDKELEIKCMSFWFMKLLKNSKIASKDKVIIDLILEKLVPCVNPMARKIVLQLIREDLLAAGCSDGLESLLEQLESDIVTKPSIDDDSMADIDEQILKSEKLLSTTTSNAIVSESFISKSDTPVGYFQYQSVASLDLPLNVSIVSVGNSKDNTSDCFINQWRLTDFFDQAKINENSVTKDDDNSTCKRVKLINSVSLFSDPKITINTHDEINC